MILEKLGKLAVAQALANGAADSQNVIDMGAVANAGLVHAYLSIITTVIESGANNDTYKADLVIANESTLDNYIKILTIDMLGNDPRLQTAYREWAGYDIGQAVGELLDGTKRYLGLIFTCADVGGTAGVTVDASVMPAKPQSKFNTQVIRSNVTKPS